jgi:putative tryptophan/tyrosine transport system substrate-binding protein
MQRRAFISLIGGAAASPLAARAQQPARVYRMALHHPSHPTSELTENGGIPYYRVFFEELRRLGYVEGRNLTVSRYSSGGRTEQYADLAREVVRTSPDVILTVTSRMVLNFKAASSTIPIVAITGDPVTLGVAASLARPEATLQVPLQILDPNTMRNRSKY